MARDVTSGVATELAASVRRPRLFYEGEFTGGTLRLWTGVGSKSWNGQTWLGAGEMLEISAIPESTDFSANGISVKLSGLASGILPIALSQARLGLQGTVWAGFEDAAGNIIADPVLAFRGRLDVPNIGDTGETCAVTITYENELMDLERARVFNWTHETQQAEHPGSLGFAFVNQLPDQFIVF